MTADLVDLGYVKAVTWVILNLVDRDRSDIVVEVRLLTVHHLLCTVDLLYSHLLTVLYSQAYIMHSCKPHSKQQEDAQLPMLQVSVAMMAKGYVSQMTLITKEVLAQGRADAGAGISGEMLKNGNLDFVKIWNEARKAEDGEVQKDPKSITDQVKDAVGSVAGNAKGELADHCTLPVSLSCCLADNAQDHDW